MKNEAPTQTALPAIIDARLFDASLPNSHLLNARALRFADNIFPVGGKINERGSEYKHRGKYGGGDKEFDQEFYKFHMGRRQEMQEGVFRFFQKRKE